MGKAASEGSDLIIVTSDNPRDEEPLEIINDILEGVSAENIVESDRILAINMAVQIATAGDVILIAGKGHETTQISQGTSRFCDDRVIAKNALERKRDHK